MLPTLLIAPAWAADLRIVPNLYVSQSYSDNVALAPAGLEQSDFVTSVRPGVSLTYGGPKLKFNASYSAEVLYHSLNSDTELRQQYSGGTIGSLELVPQFLFLDTTSSVAQYNTSVNAPLATSNINTTGNRSTVRTNSLSPYIRYNIGGEAFGVARCTYTTVSSDSSSLSNSTGSKFDVNLASGPAYVLTGWSLNYTRDTTDYNDNTAARDVTLQRFDASVRRRITPVMFLTASIGYEDNDYATITGAQPSGATWDVGFDWRPTPRTNLAATTGHRFYGRTHSLNFSHRMRRLFVGANYNESITTTRSQFLAAGQADTATVLDSLFLSRFPDPVERRQAVQQEIARSGLPSSLVVPVNFFTDQVFLQKGWAATAGLTGPVHTFVGNFFTSNREQQTPGLPAGSAAAGDFSAGTAVDQYGGSLGWSYRITGYTASAVTLTYSRSETPAIAREEALKTVRVSLNSQFGRRTSGAVSYQHAQNDSNAGFSYTENQVSAQLYMNFY